MVWQGEQVQGCAGVCKLAQALKKEVCIKITKNSKFLGSYSQKIRVSTIAYWRDAHHSFLRCCFVTTFVKSMRKKPVKTQCTQMIEWYATITNHVGLSSLDNGKMPLA